MVYILLSYLIAPFVYFRLFLRRDRGIKRLLVIQTAKIGDMVCSTHVFREIKKRYPGSCLSVMLNPVTEELLAYNPYVDERITVNQGSYRGIAGKIRLSYVIRKGGYDAVISLNPSLPFIIASFWGLVPLRIFIMPESASFTYRMASVYCSDLVRHIRGRLVAETYLKILKVIGIDSNDISREVYESPGAGHLAENLLEGSSGILIGIAITSGNKLKEWGFSNVVALTERLITGMEATVVLIGSASDREFSEKIIGSVRHKHGVVNCSGMLSLSELPALLVRLSLFIGVDTGILYMADALNIPVIDIAGPSDMDDQRPTGKGAVIMKKKEISCVPCSHAFSVPSYCKYGHRHCIADISSVDVFDMAGAKISRD